MPGKQQKGQARLQPACIGVYTWIIDPDMQNHMKWTLPLDSPENSASGEYICYFRFLFGFVWPCWCHIWLLLIFPIPTVPICPYLVARSRLPKNTLKIPNIIKKMRKIPPQIFTWTMILIWVWARDDHKLIGPYDNHNGAFPVLKWSLQYVTMATRPRSVYFTIDNTIYSVQATVPWLSQYKVVGLEIPNPSSCMRERSHMTCFAACVVAMYSASHDDNATTACCLDDQQNGAPPISAI